MFDRILLPTDGSEVSLAAAERAAALAKLCGAPLTVLFVQEPYPYAGIGSTNRPGAQAYRAEAERLAAEAFDRVAALARVPGVQITTETAEDGNPAQAIVDAARRSGADLIVMGSHGRGGVARLLLGSVASKVLELSPVPVMVVKRGA